MTVFAPEGTKINTPDNNFYLESVENLKIAMQKGIILEARAGMCNSNHDLIIPLPCANGFMPREECALGIKEGLTKDIAIISRVGKPVCFVVKEISEQGGRCVATLSRTDAQNACIEEYLWALQPGEVIPAKVTHIEQFGCFVDIGCGVPSMIPIDEISVSRIASPFDRFSVGQEILAVYKGYDGEKFYLTHKELLGTWEENAERFESGETVNGIVRSVESYGIFVELTPNLAGLAEPREGVRVGQTASVYIKSINPEKMKIKLIIVDCYDEDEKIPCEYFIQSGILSSWKYSPEGCKKHIETMF